MLSAPLPPLLFVAGGKRAPALPLPVAHRCSRAGGERASDSTLFIQKLRSGVVQRKRALEHDSRLRIYAPETVFEAIVALSVAPLLLPMPAQRCSGNAASQRVKGDGCKVPLYRLINRQYIAILLPVHGTMHRFPFVVCTLVCCKCLVPLVLYSH